MKQIALFLALAASACGTRRSEETGAVEPDRREAIGSLRINAEEEARIRRTYPDFFLYIQDWRSAVLDHANRTTLEELRKASQGRLADYASRDAELAARPPYIVIDARRDLRDRALLENERLRLINDALGRYDR